MLSVASLLAVLAATSAQFVRRELSGVSVYVDVPVQMVGSDRIGQFAGDVATCANSVDLPFPLKIEEADGAAFAAPSYSQWRFYGIDEANDIDCDDDDESSSSSSSSDDDNSSARKEAIRKAAANGGYVILDRSNRRDRRCSANDFNSRCAAGECKAFQEVILTNAVDDNGEETGDKTLSYWFTTPEFKIADQSRSFGALGPEAARVGAGRDVDVRIVVSAEKGGGQFQTRSRVTGLAANALDALAEQDVSATSDIVNFFADYNVNALIQPGQPLLKTDVFQKKWRSEEAFLDFNRNGVNDGRLDLDLYFPNFPQAKAGLQPSAARLTIELDGLVDPVQNTMPEATTFLRRVATCTAEAYKERLRQERAAAIRDD